MKSINGIEVTDRIDYNELLTKEENQAKHREVFWSAKRILEYDIKDMDRLEREEEESEVEN